MHACFILLGSGYCNEISQRSDGPRSKNAAQASRSFIDVLIHVLKIRGDKSYQSLLKFQVVGKRMIPLIKVGKRDLGVY